jgi:hypothetical protein
MAGGAVVLRHRKIGRQDVGIVGRGHGLALINFYGTGAAAALRKSRSFKAASKTPPGRVLLVE